MTEIALEPAIPILRVHDIPKTLEFYIGFLGVYIRTEARAFLVGLKAKRARFARSGASHDEATLTDPFDDMLRFDGSKRDE